jgi:hypothetical protein
MNAVGESGLDLVAGLEGAEHSDRCDRRRGELWRHVRRDARKTDHFDVKLFSGRFDSLEIHAAVIPQSKLQRMASERATDHLFVRLELIADRRPNEVGAIGVEALLDEEIDPAEIDETEIDGDFLGIAVFFPKLKTSAHRRFPSIWMAYGWRSLNFKGVRWILSGDARSPRGRKEMRPEQIDMGGGGLAMFVIIVIGGVVAAIAGYAIAQSMEGRGERQAQRNLRRGLAGLSGRDSRLALSCNECQ